MIRSLIQQLDGPAVDAVFVVGAGDASDLPELRRLQATKVVLAEAHPQLAQVAGERIDPTRGEEVWAIAVTPEPASSAHLNVLNQWRYNSLLRPERLLEYLPNLALLSGLDVASRSFADSLAHLELKAGGTNVLILDAPGQVGGLIQSVTPECLQSFSAIIVGCSCGPLYEGEVPVDDVVGVLKIVGFDVVMDGPEAVFPECTMLLRRNDATVERLRLESLLKRAQVEQATMTARLAALKAELEQAVQMVATRDKRIDDLEARWDRLNKVQDAHLRRFERKAAELCIMNKMVASLKDELRTQAEKLGARTAQVKELRSELDGLREGHAQLTGEFEARNDGLAHARASGAMRQKCLKGIQSQSRRTDKFLSRVEDHLNNLTEEFQKNLQQATRNIYRKLDQSTRNAGKQVQAFIGVHEYLATGHLASLSTERHSWPVSPDFAHYLVELIELHDYDVVVEFGSGVSTVIMAKAFAGRAERGQRASPVAMVSFDHLETYFRQTRSYLSQAGLADSVNLVLAPLQPYAADNGNTYLYYNCLDVLRALAEEHACKSPHLLVVVDGPPGKTGKHARYPAMPTVLSYFPGQAVDFLMDDYIREDEKEIVDLWQQELTAAGVEHETMVRNLEKDACLFRVRPNRS